MPSRVSDARRVARGFECEFAPRGTKPRRFTEVIKVKPATRRERDRHLLFITGVGTEARFRSFRDTEENTLCALFERVFLVQNPLDTTQFVRPPNPSVAFREAMSGVYQYFARTAVVIAPEPLQGYPERHYRGRRLRAYQNALVNLLRRGLQRSDANLSTFLKHEKIVDGAKRAVPRVIQPRRMEYNISVGVYLRPLEERIYRRLSRMFGYDVVMKGKNVFEIGAEFASAWDQFHDPVALGLDASRFDQHVGPEALEFEHGIYDLFYRDPVLRELLKWQIENTGFASTPDSDIKYKVFGCRCSGDMNTGLGNCLLMCSMVWSLFERLGLAKPGFTRPRLFNNGDDCVIIADRGMIDVIERYVPGWFTNLGFNMKVEPKVHTLESVAFCQMQPVFDGRVWRMVRNPLVSLSKDATIVSLVANTSAAFSNQCHAVASCGLSLCSGIPVLQSYYKAMGKGTKRGKLVSESFYGTGFYQLSKGIQGSHEAAITDAARVSFYEAFGVTPDLQLELEAYYDALPVLQFTVGDERGAFFPDLQVM